MATIGDIVRTCSENGVSFTDVDRVLLNEASMEEVKNNFDGSVWKTTNEPAIRLTEGEEQLVWVDKDGYEQEEYL